MLCIVASEFRNSTVRPASPQSHAAYTGSPSGPSPPVSRNRRRRSHRRRRPILHIDVHIRQLAVMHHILLGVVIPARASSTPDPGSYRSSTAPEPSPQSAPSRSPSPASPDRAEQQQAAQALLSSPHHQSACPAEPPHSACTPPVHRTSSRTAINQPAHPLHPNLLP